MIEEKNPIVSPEEPREGGSEGDTRKEGSGEHPRKIAAQRRRGGKNRRDRRRKPMKEQPEDTVNPEEELWDADAEELTQSPENAMEMPSKEMLLSKEEEDLLAEAEEDDDVTSGKELPYGEMETVPELVEVVGIRFRTSGKIYYFDPCGVNYPEGSHAILETARGTEYGEVAMTNRMVKGSEIVPPLRPALRVSTPEDDAHFAANREKEKEAFDICLQRIAAHGLEMKLIDAEYTFDNSKLLFYFTADGRVDFRELVKNLASLFRCRIELRQMGIRDEAKALGGLGICGRPYCCHSFLPDFVQVSIKMAKEQSLSLNSAKISGACGRLMCCLRYEYDTYLEEGKRTPKVDSIVHTRDGDGVVVEAKPLTGMVKIRPLDDPDAAPKVYSREDVFPGRGDPAKRPAPFSPKEKPVKDKDPKVQKEARSTADLPKKEAAPSRENPPSRRNAEKGEGKANVPKESKGREREKDRDVRGKNGGRKGGDGRVRPEDQSRDGGKTSPKESVQEIAPERSTPRTRNVSYRILPGKASEQKTGAAAESKSVEKEKNTHTEGENSTQKPSKHRPYRRYGKSSGRGNGGKGEGSKGNAS